MGVDIYGWLEVSRLEPAMRDDEYAWSGLLNLTALVDGCDEVSQLLFGFSKHALCGGELPYLPIAGNRGIPPNASGSVRSDLQAIEQHERKFGSGEFRGYTYIHAIEVEQVDWASYGVGNFESSDWATLMKLIRVLRNDGRFVNAGFRVVTWTCW